MNDLPNPLKYLFIFSLTACVASAITLYVIDLTGFLIGALAVIAYRKHTEG